jgi:hypothetical protein
VVDFVYAEDLGIHCYACYSNVRTAIMMFRERVKPLSIPRFELEMSPDAEG